MRHEKRLNAVRSSRGIANVPIPYQGLVAAGSGSSTVDGQRPKIPIARIGCQQTTLPPNATKLLTTCSPRQGKKNKVVPTRQACKEDDMEISIVEYHKALQLVTNKTQTSHLKGKQKEVVLAKDPKTSKLQVYISNDPQQCKTVGMARIDSQNKLNISMLAGFGAAAVVLAGVSVAGITHLCRKFKREDAGRETWRQQQLFSIPTL